MKGKENNPKANDTKKAQELNCAACEALFADVLDGLADPGALSAFETHTSGCEHCGSLLADARRGQKWLEILHGDNPEPSGDLMARILLKTSGAALSTAPAGGAVAAIPHRREPWAAINLAHIRHTVLQPRLGLTAAMAFFSVTLTLNLLGIHLSTVKMADLRPGNLSHTLSHRYTETRNSVVQYCDNLRFVYELESRVNEIRKTSDQQTDHEAPPTDQPKDKPPTGPTSQRDNGPKQPTTGENGKSSQPQQKVAPAATKIGEVIEAACTRDHSFARVEKQSLKVLSISEAPGFATRLRTFPEGRLA